MKIALLCSFYSLYVFWHAIPPMTQIGIEKRGGFFGQTIGLTFLALIVVAIILFSVAPSPSAITASDSLEKINLPGRISIDVNEMEKATKQLEKLIPKGK